MRGSVLGIDIGGILYQRDAGPIVGAFEAVNRLVADLGPDNVFIVSKCGPRMERISGERFMRDRFFEQTGVLPANVRFCRNRWEKAPICEQFGVTHFVDDRLEVLGYLASVRYRYLLNASDDEVLRHQQYLGQVRRVKSWEEVVTDILGH